MQMTKLEQIDGIQKLPKLHHLRFDNCRNVKGIDSVAKLKNITTLDIVGSTPKPTV